MTDIQLTHTQTYQIPSWYIKKEFPNDINMCFHTWTLTDILEQTDKAVKCLAVKDGNGYAYTLWVPKSILEPVEIKHRTSEVGFNCPGKTLTVFGGKRSMTYAYDDRKAILNRVKALYSQGMRISRMAPDRIVMSLPQRGSDFHRCNPFNEYDGCDEETAHFNRIIDYRVFAEYNPGCATPRAIEYFQEVSE